MRLPQCVTRCGAPATNILQLPFSNKYVHLSVDCTSQPISLFEHNIRYTAHRPFFLPDHSIVARLLFPIIICGLPE